MSYSVHHFEPGPQSTNQAISNAPDGPQQTHHYHRRFPADRLRRGRRPNSLDIPTNRSIEAQLGGSCCRYCLSSQDGSCSTNADIWEHWRLQSCVPNQQPDHCFCGWKEPNAQYFRRQRVSELDWTRSCRRPCRDTPAYHECCSYSDLYTQLRHPLETYDIAGEDQQASSILHLRAKFLPWNTGEHQWLGWDVVCQEIYSRGG